MLLYIIRKEEISYTRDLAMAQLQIDKTEGLKKFSDFQKTMFPWIDRAKEREEDIHKKILLKAVKDGPLMVKPLFTKQATSRLIKRKQRDETKTVSKADKVKEDLFYKKLKIGV